MCPKMGFLGVLRVKMWKFCVLTPERHYPAWIRVCWCIACQNRFNGLSSRSVERFCVQRKKKNLSGNFGYMRSSNPCGDLDQMSHVGRYGGHNHMCNIWWLSVKGCGCGERGKFAFSHWLHTSPLQHWCDRVIKMKTLFYCCIMSRWYEQSKQRSLLVCWSDVILNVFSTSRMRMKTSRCCGCHQTTLYHLERLPG